MKRNLKICVSLFLILYVFRHCTDLLTCFLYLFESTIQLCENDHLQRKIEELSSVDRNRRLEIKTLTKRVQSLMQLQEQTQQVFRKKWDDSLNEAENLEKKYISLRLYTKRIEAEVEVLRGNVKELVKVRMCDAEILDGKSNEVRELRYQCQNYETKLMQLQREVSEGNEKIKALEKSAVKSSVALRELDGRIASADSNLTQLR